MHSRLLSVFSTSIIIFGFLLGFGRAAEDDKTRIGNETIDRTVQLRTHSIYAPYIDQDLHNRWWDFGADSYVNTNKHIRLTQNRPSQMGWLWSRLGLTATNFVIEVEFKISGESSHLFGDGFAMWLTKERTQEGPVFGNQDKFEGLGIFMDTYSNGRHTYSFPRVNAMLGDGKTSYDVATDGEGQTIGGCSANYRRTNVATKLKVTYVRDKFLDVKIQYKAWDDWSDCFHIKNVTLPPNPFVGFSAMTGDVSDAHDIITVTTYSAILMKSDTRDKKKKKGIFSKPSLKSADDDEEEAPGTWLGFFFKLSLLAGVCVGGFYGYKEYQRRQAYSGGGNFGGGGGGNFGRGSGGGGFGGGMYSSNKRSY